MKQLLILSTLIIFGLTAIISAQSETKSDKIKVETKVETITYSIKGMTCQGCVSSVETKLGKINGVQKYEVDLEKGEAVVEYDPKKVNSEDIEKEFKKSPFKVTEKEKETDSDKQEE